MFLARIGLSNKTREEEGAMFWFVLIMAAFVLTGAWGVAGWAGVLLAIGSVGLYAAYDRYRSNAHATTIKGSSEVFQSIAHQVSDIAGVLESLHEELRQEREAEKEAQREKERRRFWRKVETQDSGGQGQIN
jgi:hypothetical protein